MAIKERTLAGEFTRYIALFCLTTLAILLLMMVGMGVLLNTGVLLPADAVEKELAEADAVLAGAKEIKTEMLPYDCTFGVYDAEGRFIYGTLGESERIDAWHRYKKDNRFAETNGFYHIVARENGEVCIVKYHLVARYSAAWCNKILPAPELMDILLFAAFFLLEAYVISKRYAAKMQKRLRVLNTMSEKIAASDLDFSTEQTDIREINQVMISLDHMKTALKTSLEQQWRMEEEKNTQLAALAHDIKTPLTVMRGNAELLAEGALTKADAESVRYILKSVEDIEHYQAAMRDVLQGRETPVIQQTITAETFADAFKEVAEALTQAAQMPLACTVQVEEAALHVDMAQALRAWKNVVANAIEHTNPKKGIAVSITTEKGDLLATVRDYGAGFGPEDLRHATQAFYSGDKSRHDRSHQGLGLAIATQVMTNQGGHLSYKNAPNQGAEVTLHFITEA